MRDEPQGRFVMRTKGSAVKAKKFHLYRNCGVIAGFVDQPSDFDIIDLDKYPDHGGSIIDLLGLTLCSPCNNRAHEVSALDLLAEVLLEDVDMEGNKTFLSQEADDLANKLIDRLTLYGYRIRRERRGGAS